jgi:hypothetical protein
MARDAFDGVAVAHNEDLQRKQPNVSLAEFSTEINVENVGSRFHSLRHPKREELASNILRIS